MDQVVEDGLRDLATTAQTCTSNGLTFSWLIPGKKSSLTFIFDPSSDIASFSLTIRALGFSNGIFDRLSQIPELRSSGTGTWTGTFPYQWEVFSSEASAVRAAWELLRMAPEKEKKGLRSPSLFVNDTFFDSHSAVREAVDNYVFKLGFASTAGHEITGIFLGGSGYGIPAESIVLFEAGTDGFLLTGLEEDFAVRVRYSEVHDLKFDGGILQRGGGFSGGGFGVVGFAVGAAASMALNKVTSKSEIQTSLQLLTTEGEILLYTNQGTPDQLEMLFSEARTRIRTAVSNRSTAPVSSSVADELLKLSSLREAGVLSDEEFQAAKTRLLG